MSEEVMTIAREANLLAHPENEEVSVARDTYASIRHHCVSLLKEVWHPKNLLVKAPPGTVSPGKLSTLQGEIERMLRYVNIYVKFLEGSLS